MEQADKLSVLQSNEGTPRKEQNGKVKFDCSENGIHKFDCNANEGRRCSVEQCVCTVCSGIRIQNNELFSTVSDNDCLSVSGQLVAVTLPSQKAESRHASNLNCRCGNSAFPYPCSPPVLTCRLAVPKQPGYAPLRPPRLHHGYSTDFMCELWQPMLRCPATILKPVNKLQPGIVIGRCIAAQLNRDASAR